MGGISEIQETYQHLKQSHQPRPSGRSQPSHDSPASHRSPLSGDYQPRRRQQLFTTLPTDAQMLPGPPLRPGMSLPPGMPPFGGMPLPGGMPLQPGMPPPPETSVQPGTPVPPGMPLPPSMPLPPAMPKEIDNMSLNGRGKRPLLDNASGLGIALYHWAQ
ncbi:hypothetical protein J7T55_009880 [Diaporthe amygdali]|uniref:uncharacterized protein n=1 Tax=Phomopsis amygdali TaxID=1214568 RepID=UPI0022FE18B9|nr:uncharacterized protein J7T55_009880 [Diaporthe amygdali]KAJ0116730.1 hypothetical protein J7T55_009880 [Diaporthe amygdali]